MKSTIKIEDGRVRIELKPENTFEETMIEDMDGFELSCWVDRNGMTGEKHLEIKAKNSKNG